MAAQHDHGPHDEQPVFGMRTFARGHGELDRFADAYERHMVPAMFGPWGQIVVDAVGVGAGDRALDVACGTGAVTRLLAARVGLEGWAAGVDVNTAMVDVARRQLAPEVLLVEGDACALPVRGGAVDVVVCHQGLQFVPDRAAAVREMARVVRPGGRLAIASWTDIDENVLPLAVATAARAMGWAAGAAVAGTPLGNEVPTPVMVAASGFVDVAVERRELVTRWPALADWIDGFATGPPLSRWYLPASQDQRHAFVGAVLDALADRRTAGGHDIPTAAYLLTASRS